MPHRLLLGLAALCAGALPAQGGGKPPAGTLPPPVAVSTNGALSATDLARGRQLYISKCARCHKFHDPANYSDTDWEKWMASMSKKSKLKPDQREVLSRYLESFRAAKDQRDGAVENGDVARSSGSRASPP